MPPETHYRLSDKVKSPDRLFLMATYLATANQPEIASYQSVAIDDWIASFHLICEWTETPVELLERAKGKELDLFKLISLPTKHCGKIENGRVYMNLPGKILAVMVFSELGLLEKVRDATGK